MDYKLVKLKNFSGEEASVYSIYIEDEGKTLFDLFIEENINLHISELKDVISRLKTIGHKTGAREQFFKLKEGKPGDGVCALYDKHRKNLRLYCIRYGSLLLIVGGGGLKKKNIRALQEDGKLNKENKFLKRVSEDIQKRMKEGDIRLTDDYMDFDGNLIFNEEDEE